MNIHVFTSAAGNYLPKVRALFRSLRQHRPEWRMHIAVADAPNPALPRAQSEADEVHDLDTLGIPNWRAWAFCHSLIELATAIKPFALKKILARSDCDAALYLDPDIIVFSELDEIVKAFDAADILLTPHLTAPETDTAAIVANEICTSQHGIYNLGFIGVAARDEGRAFARWWAERTYHFCQEDYPNGVYTDQRWVDFAPSFFDRVRILRSPALNVGPWNLGTRRVSGSVKDGFMVNGHPLGFYHFSQVDKPVHDALNASQSAVDELVRWYRTETASLPSEHLPSWGLGTFENGEPILHEQRLVYSVRSDLQQVYPDPFRTMPDGYLMWWRKHARREFRALFDSATKAAEMRRLISGLTYSGLRLPQEPSARSDGAAA